ncbi:MAG: hypothetical protein Q4A55_00135 [Aerococcus sp.]|nr:hypothetical protein [Aerococcus sp.]
MKQGKKKIQVGYEIDDETLQFCARLAFETKTPIMEILEIYVNCVRYAEKIKKQEARKKWNKKPNRR